MKKIKFTFRAKLALVSAVVGFGASVFFLIKEIIRGMA
jgi:hypothetical protein